MFDDDVRRAGGFAQLFELWRRDGRSVEEEVQRAFSQDTELLAEIGIKVAKVGDGYAEISFPFSGLISGRRGYPHVHGGVIMAMLDTTCGLAVMTKNSYTNQSTLELKVNFLKLLYKEPFRVVGRVIHAGTSTAVVEGEVYDSDGELCAKALGTWFLRQ